MGRRSPSIQRLWGPMLLFYAGASSVSSFQLNPLNFERGKLESKEVAYYPEGHRACTSTSDTEIRSLVAESLVHLSLGRGTWEICLEPLLCERRYVECFTTASISYFLLNTCYLLDSMLKVPTGIWSNPYGTHRASILPIFTDGQSA